MKRAKLTAVRGRWLVRIGLVSGILGAGAFPSSVEPIFVSRLVGQQPGSSGQVDQQAERDRLVSSSVDYLRKVQGEDGSFSSQAGPGVTGLVVGGLVGWGERR